MNRRDILKSGMALSGVTLLGARGPALIAAEASRPKLPYGVMSGDLSGDRAMIWAASDRPARMIAEWSRDPQFRRPTRIAGPLATPASDHIAKLDLAGLPAGETIHYRVAFEDADGGRARSDWTSGRLRLPGTAKRPLRFTFAGDEAGQGFGINLDLGGYRLYEAMRRQKPDFFIHQGDQIYADGPLKEEVALPGGGLWRNIVTPAKSRVAASLDDFRGCFAYNLLDANKRRFLAEVPMLVQWDDHEVRNNWYPDKVVANGPSMRELAGLARRAMLDYNPMRVPDGARGIERRFAMGPLLDVFMLDARSQRGTNGSAAAEGAGPGTFGAAQIAWLKDGLNRSRATWKLIASDLPLSLTVADFTRDVPPGGMEGIANGRGGQPGGREAEIADLLSFIRAEGIANIVWISADVHHASAIHYHPDRAAFADFRPFWEIVAGPINAGTGSMEGNPLDRTFGPKVEFAAVPGPVTDTSPRAGLQFFGLGEIDPDSGALTLTIIDSQERRLWSIELPADQSNAGRTPV